MYGESDREHRPRQEHGQADRAQAFGPKPAGQSLRQAPEVDFDTVNCDVVRPTVSDAVPRSHYPRPPGNTFVLCKPCVSTADVCGAIVPSRVENRRDTGRRIESITPLYGAILTIR